MENLMYFFLAILVIFPIVIFWCKVKGYIKPSILGTWAEIGSIVSAVVAVAGLFFNDNLRSPVAEPTLAPVSMQPNVAGLIDVTDTMSAITPTNVPAVDMFIGIGITFVSNRNGNKDIFTFLEDENSLKNITSSLEDEDWPAWSPDGQQLLFVFSDGRAENIISVNANGKNRRNISANLLAKEFSHPVWSPDGQRILFSVRFPKLTLYDLYYINADGTNWVGIKRPLGDNNRFGGVWSTNANYVAFHYINSADTESDIYLYDFSANELTQLTNFHGLETAPAWSPDGKKIAFVRYDDIWVMNADGSDAHQLTNTDAIEALPTWSPDGEFIAYQTDRDGNWEIYILSVDGLIAPVNITNNPAIDEHPAWRP